MRSSTAICFLNSQLSLFLGFFFLLQFSPILCLQLSLDSPCSSGCALSRPPGRLGFPCPFVLRSALQSLRLTVICIYMGHFDAPSCLMFRFVAIHILFLLQVSTTNICPVCCSVPVTSGTTCTGLHTLIRMPVLFVVFRLETGGEHPFAVPYKIFWA